ncbi:conserved hypothetical protein [Sporisorium reilianum SRZ2]|uniref:protein-tyrosine-phosphatase n=1 Tax=Sporisorium reilianum (strain SRZ2) TaxID=999809 RepID=E6ZM50_SPORE|nr:conserved hypothetical protein [Sporisorium reilianum SRZ2]
MELHQDDLSPPPTPGPSSFAPPLMHSTKPARAPVRSLSLRIPEDGQAFGGLTQPSLPSALALSPPTSHVSASVAAPPITLQLASNQAGPSTLALPPTSRLTRKRPSRLNLAPPSLSDESAQSSRSMPASPVAISRSGSKAEHLDSTAPPASAISEAVKHLSSTLRGTPRRRPSMPFKAATVQESAYPEPPSAASSRNRPPEAFRDPSEHILSGKGSTLQHARSVYSHGPVQVLPGLFLGDEHNARDTETLSALGITTILNVAKETVFDFGSQQSAATSVYPNASSHATWSHPANAIGRSDAKQSCIGNGPSPHGASASERVPPTPNTYYTPPSTASLSFSKGNGQASSPRDAISASVLRNTSSTPNLLTQFLDAESSAGPSESMPLHSALAAATASADATGTSEIPTLTAQDVLRYRSLRRTSNSSSSDDAFDTASSPSSSRAASTCTSTATELTPPVLNHAKNKEGGVDTHDNVLSDEGTSQHPSPSYASDNDSQTSPGSWFTKVELPANATASRVPASIEHGRTHEMRYIKLPWTHDETDLASGRGGFAQGCALIAEALGMDDRFWYAAKIAQDRDACAALQDDSSLEHVQTSAFPGKILVHCQCGVSRSATLVIAFVMQAAAMRYGFDTARGLLGMHDCYNMVKDKSSSISPNISLIYQLVEWERYLSSAAGRLRDVLGMGACMGNESEAGGHLDANGAASMAGAGWSTEPMDEAMWSKMRLEEEEKEAAEEDRRREERLSEAMRLATERRAAQDRLEGRLPDVAVGGDSGSGSLMQRRRKKAAPALQLQTAAPGLAAPGSSHPAAAAAPTPSPGLGRRRPPALQLNSARAGAGDSNKVEVETPFQTARMEAWSEPVHHDADGDVMMNDLEPPQTPLRSSAAESDVVSTPTARTTAGGYTPDSAGWALRTPNAYSLSCKTAAAGASGRTQTLETAASRGGSSDSGNSTRGGAVPTTLVSPSSPGLSPAMSSSLSLGSRPNAFSFGDAPRSGSLSARLEADSGSSSRSRARPDSMQSTMSSSSSSTALFGVTALSREERKKQHRRTFSSDWPTLQANLASQRRKSKADAVLALTGVEAEMAQQQQQ